MSVLEFYIATVNIFLCYIFFSVQTVLPYEGCSHLIHNTLYSQLETYDLTGRYAPRRERIRNTRGKNGKKPVSVKLSEVIKKRESFHLSLDPKSCFYFSVTKTLILQWVFCILDLIRRAALQPATFDTIRLLMLDCFSSANFI